MTTANSIDVTAIIVSYNSANRIRRSIRAIEDALAGREYELIVVDNASSDASAAKARSAIKEGYVMANPENLGYGKAVNQALTRARGRACLILNDDARLGPNDVGVMWDVLFSAEDVALVGPRIVDESNHPMPAARVVFPGLSEEAQRLRDLLSRTRRNALYPAHKDPTDVAWLVAACVLGKTNVLRFAGGFNPAFFLYSEDIDLSRRLRSLGYRVVTVPDATCVHIGSASTREEWDDSTRSRRRRAGRDIYYRIWLSRADRSLVHLRRAFGLRGQPDRLRHHLKMAIWDGPSLKRLRRIEPLDFEDRVTR